MLCAKKHFWLFKVSSIKNLFFSEASSFRRSQQSFAIFVRFGLSLLLAHNHISIRNYCQVYLVISKDSSSTSTAPLIYIAFSVCIHQTFSVIQHISYIIINHLHNHDTNKRDSYVYIFRQFPRWPCICRSSS